MKRIVCSTVILTALIVVFAGCTTNIAEYISKDYDIYGTWVNSDYNDLPRGAKLVFHPNGIMDAYDNETDTETNFHAEFYITNKWFDAKGNVWYTSIYKFQQEIEWSYFIAKVSDSGKTLEFVISRNDYPAKIDPEKNFPGDDEDYEIHFRK